MAFVMLNAGLWSAWAGIIPGTLVSEDLTCITVGLLIREHGLSPLVGVLGCFIGIYLGDLGLWLAGRWFGWRGLEVRWIAARFAPGRIQQLGRWFDQHGAAVIVASRFLPGTRLPLYVAAGMLGRKAGRFAWWTAVAAALWTPLIVLGAAAAGGECVRRFEAWLGYAWLALAATAISLLLLIRLALRMCSVEGRRLLAVRIVRLWRYEFWPAWLFYLPLWPYGLYLVLRYRGLATVTAANPGIPHGGVVGESKYAILAQLPPASIIPSLLIPPDEPKARLSRLREWVLRSGWQYPLILKPDAAQRGAGVKRVNDEAGAIEYLAKQRDAVLAQTYDPGPFEAGIFYYRIPGEPVGRIFSITDKVFPVLRGDGRHTVGELILAHPRYRLQSGVFRARHQRQLGRVLAADEELPLALAGNHCQGTLFRDGAHLWTPELEAAVDAIAKHFKGFYVGRFDVRYTDVEAFKTGRDLRIVELNGVTSESTNLYDPAWSLWAAYRTLVKQWGLVFRIGYLNRGAGHRPTRLRDLARSVCAYYRDRHVTLLAD